MSGKRDSSTDKAQNRESRISNLRRGSLPVTPSSSGTAETEYNRRESFPTQSRHNSVEHTRTDSLPTRVRDHSADNSNRKYTGARTRKWDDHQSKLFTTADNKKSSVGVKKESTTGGYQPIANYSTTSYGRSSFTKDFSRYTPAASSHAKTESFVRKPKGSSTTGNAHQHAHNNHSTTSLGRAKRLSKGDIVEQLTLMETDYVDKLDKLIKVFVRPLSEHSLTAKYRHTLFSNVKEIYSVHVSIQKDLEYASRDDVTSIANTLIANRDNLDVHAEFNHQLPKAIKLLDELKVSEPKVYSTIMSGETPSLRLKLVLHSIPNILTDYIHTLEKLLKVVEKVPAEQSLVEKALTAMKDINEHVNHTVDDLDIKDKLAKIQQQMTAVDWGQSSLTSDFGKLVLEEEGMNVRRKTSASDRIRHVLLLEKLLIVTKPEQANSSYMFEQAIEVARLSSVNESRSQQIRLEKADGVSLLLSANSRSQTKKWLNTIEQVREKVSPKEAMDDMHYFRLFTFKELSECDVCKLLLKGAYSQGYYCPRTQKQCHFECLEACKRLPRRQIEGRRHRTASFELPKCVFPSELEKQYFGGYFGKVGSYLTAELTSKPRTNSEIQKLLIEAVQTKLSALKSGSQDGGFRYVKIELKATNPVSPGCFVMWESRSKGVQEQVIPKAGFIEYLCQQLSLKTQDISLVDIEEIVKQHEGQVNAYPDTTTGEWYIAGFYQEPDEGFSSDDDKSYVDILSDDFLDVNSANKKEKSGKPTIQNSHSGGKLNGTASNLSNHKSTAVEDSNASDGKTALKSSVSAAQQKKLSNRLSQLPTNKR